MLRGAFLSVGLFAVLAEVLVLVLAEVSVLAEVLVLAFVRDRRDRVHFGNLEWREARNGPVLQGKLPVACVVLLHEANRPMVAKRFDLGDLGLGHARVKAALEPEELEAERHRRERERLESPLEVGLLAAGVP